MTDIQQEIQEDKTKFPEDYSESVDWYTELATSAPVTAGEMITDLRARVAELEEALTQASQAGLRAMDHVEEQARKIFALRAQIRESKEALEALRGEFSYEIEGDHAVMPRESARKLMRAIGDAYRALNRVRGRDE